MTTAQAYHAKVEKIGNFLVKKLFKKGVKLKNYTMELKSFGNTEQEYAVYECVKNFLKKDEKSA